MQTKKFQFVKADHFLLGALLVVLLLHYGNFLSQSIDFVLITFFASIATVPVLYSAYQSLKNRKINVDLLAGVALSVSILNQQWASAVFINLMLTSARIFDAYTQDSARNAIKSLLKLRPEKVKVQKGQEIVEELISRIKKGDLIVVELGERIPVDGIVVRGQAQIDQSSLTGESLPVEKNLGDEVLSSTMNISGSLVIRAEKVGKDTTFEKMVKLVEQSQNDKAGIQTTADKFTAWYISVTFLGAILIYVFSRDLNLVLSVLLVTCADDIAVAVPMAFSAGIASAARKGIIIKGGSFLEGLMRVKTILIDKTGTLTKGVLKVNAVYVLGDKTKQEIISLAASADFFSRHPVAHAVIEYANANKIVFEKTEEFEEYSGLGSHAVLAGKKIICGKMAFLQNEGVIISDQQLSEIEKIKAICLGSILLVAYDSNLLGIISLEDEIRAEAKETIQRLHTLGVEQIVILTGDNEKIAKKVADFVGVKTFHANLLPENKLEYIKKYLSKDHKIAMIGDGVNDAASLALADIGIAMGALGADAAIEAADIALMKDDLSKVAQALEMGKAVEAISRQDFWIWGVVNIVGLGLVFAKMIGPEGAAAYNFITDFFPLMNSMRMFGFGLKGFAGTDKK